MVHHLHKARLGSLARLCDLLGTVARSAKAAICVLGALLAGIGSGLAAGLTSEQARQLTLDEIAIMQWRDLALVRELCADHDVADLRKRSEADYGPDSFPEAAEYCLAALRRAVETDETPSLYMNLALQEVGRGEFSLAIDAATIGTAPVTIMRNIRAAAEEGGTSYTGADGRTRPLSCPLALDAGLSWGAANPDRVERPDFTDQQIDRMASACYRSDVTEVTIAATGEVVPIQKIGLIAGERLGKRFKSATAGTISP